MLCLSGNNLQNRYGWKQILNAKNGCRYKDYLEPKHILLHDLNYTLFTKKQFVDTNIYCILGIQTPHVVV